MKIKQTLKRFYEFLLGNRRCGHTSLLNKIAKENDVYVLIHRMDMIKEFDSEVHSKLIPIDKLSILQGAPHKPILIDNYTLLELLDDAINAIEYKDQLAYSRKKTIRRIKDIIVESEMHD